MPTVSLDQLQGAVDWVSIDSLANEAYICRQTGKIFWISGDAGMVDDEDDIPEDIQDVGKYALVPDKYYLDLGNKLAFDFAVRYLADQYDEVREMFRRKGAYQKYKGLLLERNLLEEWYAYNEEQIRKALKSWCESEGLGIER
jgi:hypothetical protein